jgi:hypothetical protein
MAGGAKSVFAIVLACLKVRRKTWGRQHVWKMVQLPGRELIHLDKPALTVDLRREL